MANIVRRTEPQGSLSRSRSRDRDYGSFLDPWRTMREFFRFDPFRDLDLFPSMMGEMTFMPNVDVRETKDAYVFEVDLPGVEEDDVDISATERQLRITGRREEESDTGNGEGYYSKERIYGGFSRTFALPEGCDSENIQAEMKNGVLTVTVPKRPEVQPKKVQLGAKRKDGGQTLEAAASTAGKGEPGGPGKGEHGGAGKGEYGAAGKSEHGGKGKQETRTQS